MVRVTRPTTSCARTRIVASCAHTGDVAPRKISAGRRVAGLIEWFLSSPRQEMRPCLDRRGWQGFLLPRPPEKSKQKEQREPFLQVIGGVRIYDLAGLKALGA